MKATDLTTSWYTTSFISDSLKNYLDDQGYRIVDEAEENTSNCDELIIATKIFGKEYIEVRGTLQNKEETKEETESSKRSRLLSDAMYWLSDVLLSPIAFFANNDGKNRSLCLPDIDQYRELLLNLKDYFTTNNLNLKVYLVNESGQVQVQHLNEVSQKDADVTGDEDKM